MSERNVEMVSDDHWEESREEKRRAKERRGPAAPRQGAGRGGHTPPPRRRSYRTVVIRGRGFSTPQLATSAVRLIPSHLFLPVGL